MRVERKILSALLWLVTVHTSLAWGAPRYAQRAVVTSIELIDIPRGQFVMGTEAMVGAQEGYPPHEVTIAPFRLAGTLVTFNQYDVFAKATGRALPQDEGWGRGDRPVINIDRQEMLAFIAWLNADGHRHFRLPTESEWEYAARAGTRSAYYWGDGVISDYANTATNTGRDTYPFTSPVRSFLPNAWGLFDMAGNVWEMTQDCRHSSFEGAPANGSAWMGEPCDSYIVRGGCYTSISRGVEVTSRAAASASFRSSALGFRLAETRADSH
jgi:formylglycine-generating enzyme required for sulfatase activity